MTKLKQGYHIYVQHNQRHSMINHCDRVRNWCLMPNEQFLAISWREQVTFNEMMMDISFVLDQHN